MFLLRSNLAMVYFSLLSFSFCKFINGKIIGAFILPHGGIALNPKNFLPSNPDAKQQALQIHKWSKILGRKIVEMQPDLILLSTPHGRLSFSRFPVEIFTIMLYFLF